MNLNTSCYFASLSRLAMIGLSAAALHVALAGFIWSQTKRVRLVFYEDNFELFNLSNSGKSLKEKPSDYVTGTANRWRYDDIVDYGFFPNETNPFIIYFKETATPEEQWGNFEYWGKFAALFDPTHKTVEGQPHFMPALMDPTEFINQMKARGVKRRSVIVDSWGNQAGEN